MKKIIAILLILCTAALFCSCDKKATENSKSENSATQQKEPTQQENTTQQEDPYDSIFEQVIKDMEDYYEGDYDLAKKLIPKDYLEYNANKEDMTVEEYVNEDLEEMRDLKIVSEYKIHIKDKTKISGELFEDYAKLLSKKCKIPIESVTQVFELSVSVDATFAEGEKAEDHPYLLVDKIGLAEINGFWYPVDYWHAEEHNDGYDSIHFIR